jgi:hypothetical protein
MLFQLVFDVTIVFLLVWGFMRFVIPLFTTKKEDIIEEALPLTAGSKLADKEKELKKTMNKLKEAQKELEITSKLKDLTKESIEVSEILSKVDEELTVIKVQNKPSIKAWTNNMDALEKESQKL